MNTTVIGGTLEAAVKTLSKSISPAFADALTRHRLAVPISQDDFAGLVGVTLPAVNNWERMYGSTSLYLAARCARVLGIESELRAYNRLVPCPVLRREDLRPQNAGVNGLYRKRVRRAKLNPAHALDACRRFADRLETAMKERGIDGRQLCGLAGVHPGKLQRILDADRPELVPMVTAANLAHALGMPDKLADFCEPDLKRVQP